MTLHIRAVHSAERRQSDDRVIGRIQDSTTAKLAEELRPLRWPLPKSEYPKTGLDRLARQPAPDGNAQEHRSLGRRSPFPTLTSTLTEGELHGR